MLIAALTKNQTFPCEDNEARGGLTSERLAITVDRQ